MTVPIYLNLLTISETVVVFGLQMACVSTGLATEYLENISGCGYIKHTG